MANKFNPGQTLIYLSFVLAMFSMVFAGIIGRTDVYILALGVGLFAYGLGADIPLVLLLGSIAAFLGSYLPFGVTSGTVIQGFEGFADKKDEEDFADKKDEEEGFADKNTEEEFEDEQFEDDKEERFESGKQTEEDFEDEKKESFEDEKEKEGFEEDGEGFEDDVEGFEDGDDEGFEDDGEGFEDGDEVEGFRNANASDKSGFEGFANPKKKSKKHRPPPDNGSRAEMFQLGKKYKMPKETDDEEYHLDAGTTFLNAYKSLKPDQINAMTKDTQELINTQKQLMSTLNTLKPLITDGKQMMDTFQNYFGAGGLEGMGNLGAMAEKFSGSPPPAAK